MSARKTPPPGRKKPAATKAAPQRASKTPTRGSSPAEHRGHSPKAGGSIPSPATKKTTAGKRADRAAGLPSRAEKGSTPSARSKIKTPVDIRTPRATTIGAELLARKGAPDREQPLTPTDEAFITEYLRNGQNGTAAWIFTHPGTKPDSAATMASRRLRKVNVSDRIAAERGRLTRQHELTREQLLAEFLAIARADPNELVQMRAVACALCWGGAEHNGRWTEPDPECEACLGDGHAALWIADTRKLSPDAKALYAGVHQTKDGIKILMHDKVAALVNAGKIIGAFELDNRQKDQSTAEALRDFFTGLHSAQGSGPGLPIVAPADVPRQRRPTAKG